MLFHLIHTCSIIFPPQDYTAVLARRMAYALHVLCLVYLFVQNDNTKVYGLFWLIQHNFHVSLGKYYNQPIITPKRLVLVLTWTQPCVVLVGLVLPRTLSLHSDFIVYGLGFDLVLAKVVLNPTLTIIHLKGEDMLFCLATARCLPSHTVFARIYDNNPCNIQRQQSCI